MSTPYEFGAGYDIGSSFVTDQNETPFWEFRWMGTTPASQTSTAGAAYPFLPIQWDTLNSTNPTESVVGDFTYSAVLHQNTDFIAPKTAVYSITANVTGESASTTVCNALLDMEVIRADGSQPLFINLNKDLSTASNISIYLQGSVELILFAGDRVRLLVFATGEDFHLYPFDPNYSIGGVTHINRHTYMQIQEISDEIPPLKTITLKTV